MRSMVVEVAGGGAAAVVGHSRTRTRTTPVSSSTYPSACSSSSCCYYGPLLLIKPLIIRTIPQFKLARLVHNNSTRLVSVSVTVTASASSASTPKTTVVDNDAAASVQQQHMITSCSSSNWPVFARNVSGEWDGYGADFTSEGKPIELPESVVPEAYREWEVRVWDWQTQCPTLAEPDNLTAMYKLIKLLPTVGCEADAATRFSIDERNIGGANNSVSAFAYQSSGSYVAVWTIDDHGSYRVLELEHCLVHPQDRESRMRIVQVVRVGNCKLVLQNIRVFVEQWYGPFRNGDQLGGCSIRDTAFASTDAPKSSEVMGPWQGLNAVASFQTSNNSILQELLDDSVQTSVRDEHNLILLPKNLWSSLKVRKDGDTCCEVGWLFERGCAITSRCIFSSNADLKEIVKAQETAAQGQ